MATGIRVVLWSIVFAAVAACGDGGSSGSPDLRPLADPDVAVPDVEDRATSTAAPTATNGPEVPGDAPPTESPTDPIEPPVIPSGECLVTGCSGHLCATEDVVSTCEWLPEYGCFRFAICEPQASGACGWTATAEQARCLAELEIPPLSTPLVSPTPQPNPTRVADDLLFLPGAAPDDRVILFGAYGADAVSSTTIAGQDEETVTARVEIEPGESPLYVVLSSYEPMIWRFEGAVARVRQVVVFGWGAQGVMGIAAERVAAPVDLSREMPHYFYSPSSNDALRLKAALQESLGRAVDDVFGEYSFGTLSLPSGDVAESGWRTSVPVGLDPEVYHIFGLSYRQGGIVDIAPEDVVSIAPAERYEVWPHGFGLAQLVGSGAVEYRSEYFLVVQPIPRFPGGLFGAHSVDFVLAAGVPMPAGNPGHSCVFSEETGAPLTDSPSCRLSPPSPEPCDLPQASGDEEIVLFGTYEGDAISTVTVAGPDDVTHTARVVVEEGDTPLYVVLASYSHIVWRFEGATERIARVGLTGRGVQGITGVAEAQVIDPSGTADCTPYFYDVRSPAGVAAQRAVAEALGRAIDVVAGSYSVGTLHLPDATAENSPRIDVIPPGFDPDVYRFVGLWFNPGGVVEIDPTLVMSSAPVESYDVLPQGFGLAQLVSEGGLEIEENFFPFGRYYIARTIPRFPAGLHGAHSVIFVLGAGVPMPAGDPGHSCVVSEETGHVEAGGAICANLQ